MIVCRNDLLVYRKKDDINEELNLPQFNCLANAHSKLSIVINNCEWLNKLERDIN